MIRPNPFPQQLFFPGRVWQEPGSTADEGGAPTGGRPAGRACDKPGVCGYANLASNGLGEQGQQGLHLIRRSGKLRAARYLVRSGRWMANEQLMLEQSIYQSMN